ncbi:MAG: GGDEF domain-containing protein [Blautia sp.]|nr:GGDEF domain-containing protein [Blautia sp.]MCM1199774.1 GGDEF domain-containing protein [Bacteroides fragilis]
MKKTKKPLPKTLFRTIWILYALISTLIWLPQVDRLLAKDYDAVSSCISLDDCWEIRIGDDIYHDVSLNDFRFDAVQKGDEIIMSRKLPDDLGASDGALRLHIRQSAVRMYLDDELFYEYGHDRITQGKMVGSGCQFINFPNEACGQTLTIHLYQAENNAFSGLDSLRIYPWENAFRILMTENRIALFAGCFLLIFGLVAMTVTIFALAFSLKYIRLFCVSLFSLLIGLWTLCYYNVVLIFSIPLYSISLLEYLSLYLAPIPMLIYMREDVRRLRQKALQYCYRTLLIVQTASTFCIIALHGLDIVHLAAALSYMQMLIVCDLVYFIFIEIGNLKSSRPIDRLLLIGMLIVGACISYDLISYWSLRHYGGSPFSLRGAAPVGVIIFIAILICCFYLNLTQKMMQETERNFLLKSAYTDELTQIHNRRYCMEHMNRIRETENLNYTIICFDLNDLKKTNDTYGHTRGDILIKSAAEVIKNTFEAHGIVARIGGDEFIAILNTIQTEEIDRLLEQFQADIDRKNQEITNLNMSIAYGCASCGTREYNIDKVYQIADNRMYEKKRQQKAQKQMRNPSSHERIK